MADERLITPVDRLRAAAALSITWDDPIDPAHTSHAGIGEVAGEGQQAYPRRDLLPEMGAPAQPPQEVDQHGVAQIPVGDQGHAGPEHQHRTLRSHPRLRPPPIDAAVTGGTASGETATR